MIKKIQSTLYLLFFLLFITFITNFYFSDQNIKKINKSRAFYAINKSNDNLDLPILENDTNDIIEYTNDVELYKGKKKKYFFWNLISNNQ